MNKDSLYAFYGSLRQGMKLHQEFQDSMEYLHSIWLKGFDLYALPNYPFATKSESLNSRILVEVMRITNPKVEKEIFKIEMDAGYYFENVVIEGVEVGIFLFKDAANYQRVNEGDWVKFFGLRSK